MVSSAQAREKYDQLVDRYEEIFFYVGDSGRRLIEFAALPPGSRVLDVGAGRGAVTRAALALDCAVTAIDASPRMIERLVEDHPAVTGLVMDAARLDFADGSFDLATAGFRDVERVSIEMPVPIADPAALWDWLMPRGLAEIHEALPGDRRADFRTRFLEGARTMHDDGGITLDFAATLHRARHP